MVSRTLTYSIYVTIIFMGMIFLILVLRENLHLVCYTESLAVVLFLLPHKCGRDLN